MDGMTCQNNQRLVIQYSILSIRLILSKYPSFALLASLAVPPSPSVVAALALVASWRFPV